MLFFINVKAIIKIITTFTIDFITLKHPSKEKRVRLKYYPNFGINLSNFGAIAFGVNINPLV